MTADLFFEKNMVQHFVHASDLVIVVSCIVWITPLFFSRVYVFICTCMRVCVCVILNSTGLWSQLLYCNSVLYSPSSQVALQKLFHKYLVLQWCQCRSGCDTITEMCFSVTNCKAALGFVVVFFAQPFSPLCMFCAGGSMTLPFFVYSIALFLLCYIEDYQRPCCQSTVCSMLYRPDYSK